MMLTLLFVIDGIKKLFVAKVLLGINNVVIKIGCHMHN